MTTQVPADLELATRHVIEGAQRVLSQTRIFAKLKSDGHETAEAEGLLAELRHSLALMQEHRQRLQVEQDAR